MADDDTNLVSEVKIEGVDESAAKLEEYAKRGEDAFDKIGEAAKKSSGEVADASDKIESATKDIGEAADKASDVAGDAGKKIAETFKKVGDSSQEMAKKVDPKQLIAWAAASKDAVQAASNFGNSLGTTVRSLGSFAARMGGAIAIVGAATIGVIKLAQGIAKSTSTSNAALKSQTRLQIANNNAYLQSVSSSLSFESAQKKLFRSFQDGSITYSDYSKQLYNLRQEYNEQIRNSARLQAAQEAVREENEKLKQQAADRAAYQALTDRFGTQLTGALLSLGRTAISVSNTFRDEFGPVLATVVDQINTQLQAFMAKNGTQMIAFFKQIAVASADVFKALLASIPQLIDLFNNVLLPVLKIVGEGFTVLAGVVNSLFGTNLTGSTLAFAAALLYVTNGFTLAGNAIRTLYFGAVLLSKGITLITTNVQLMSLAVRGVTLLFSPWGLAIAALVVGLTALYLAVDWVAFGATIKTFIDNVVSWFAALPGTVGGYFQALWDHIKEIATSLVNDVVTIFNAITDWFTALPQKVVDVMTSVKDAIVKFFTDAVTQALAPIQNFYNTVKAWFEGLLSLLGAIAGSGSTAGGDQTQAFARGGKVSGHIRGAGTSTSDSIAAWLSNNEFVVRAKAVAKYGVGFLNAINQGRLSFPETAQKFAVGGLVSALNVGNSSVTPSLETPDGGSSLRPFNLQIGNDIFEGLLAPESVANKLVSFAVSKKTNSTGRKPSWVGAGG